MSGGAAATQLGLGAEGCSLSPSERRRRGSEPGPAGNELRLSPTHARGQGGADCSEAALRYLAGHGGRALQGSGGRRRATEQGVLLRPMYQVTAIRARCLDALLLLAEGNAE